MKKPKHKAGIDKKRFPGLSAKDQMPIMKILKGKGKKVKHPKGLEGRLKGPGNRKPQNYTQLIVEKKPQTRGRGRPSKKAEIDLVKVAQCAEAGMTEHQMAIALGLTRETINQYKKAWPEFSDAITKKANADGDVERSLWERANGYEYEEVKTEKDNKGYMKTTKVKKFMPPEPVAMIFWLKNRQPEKWRDKKEFDGRMTFAELIASQHDK
mgnify:CR=1 FL=1